jgi:hypothetical protein
MTHVEISLSLLILKNGIKKKPVFLLNFYFYFSNHMFLKSSLSNGNHPYNTMQVSSTLLYWTHVQIIMWSNPLQVRIFLLFHAAMLLFYIVQRIDMTKVLYFSKICYRSSFQDPIYLAPVYVLLKFKFGVASNGIMSTLNLIQIHPVVLELKYVNRHNLFYMCSFCANNT